MTPGGTPTTSAPLTTGARARPRQTHRIAVLRYLSHPNVVVDPDTPIPRWGLSDVGIARATAMCRRPWATSIGRIVSSDETKARQTAEILGDRLGVAVEVRAGIGENDRAATGYLPPNEFERLADAFFAHPERSVRGWERAVDAQARIVAGLADLLVPTDADVAVVGHGGVGTLWYCWLAGVAIDRRHDQPGQGHYFTVDLDTATPSHGWRPVDGLPG